MDGLADEVWKSFERVTRQLHKATRLESKLFVRLLVLPKYLTMKKTLLLILVCFYTFSDAQVQLTDVASSRAASLPWRFFTFNNSMYFLASNGETGTELYMSDGTPDGTSLLKDINLGTGASLTDHAIELDGKLYFSAYSESTAHQIWATDGSSMGTYQVTDDLNAPIGGLAQDGEFVYFTKHLASSGTELWKTDGTPGGAILVKTGIQAVTRAQNFISALGLIFFTIRTPNNEIFLWRSDGTDAGTFPVSGPIGGYTNLTDIHPGQFVEYGGALYFSATKVLPDPNAVALMKTDGTVSGTQVVTGTYDGALWTELHDVIVHQDKMYFLFFEKDSRHLSIWESQGAADNTVKIYDHKAMSYFVPSLLSAAGDNLFFTSGNDANGTSLIKLNVTTRQHEFVKELVGLMETPSFFFPDMDMNIIKAAEPEKIFVRSNKLLSQPADLWVSDGSEAGTVKLSNIAFHISNMTVYSGELFYAGAAEGDFDYELWKSDGTGAGTGLVKDINPHVRGLIIDAFPMATEKGAVFSAADNEHGFEFWVTDGTPSGSSSIDIRPGKDGSFPRIIRGQNKAFFTAMVEHPTSQIFWSDGTTAGTKQLSNFPHGSNVIPRLVADGEDRFFVCVGNQDGTTSLYTLSMSSGDINEIKNFGMTGSGFPYYVDWLAVANKTLYFTLGGTGSEIWKSDGTNEGTVKVMSAYGPSHLYGVGNQLYFTQNDPSSTARGLYKSDGSEAGTTLLKTFDDPSANYNQKFFAIQNKLLLTVDEAPSGRELWITDGTQGNTVMLKDIYEGGHDGIFSPGYVAFENAVYFTAVDPAHGAELWRTDGTADGTVLVKDILPGPDGSNPMYLSATSDGLYFAAYTPEHGYEIWQSDGTAEGTKLKLDFAPGATYSNPRGFVYIGMELVFLAQTQQAGWQLWSYEEQITSTIEDPRGLVSVYPNPSTGIYKIETEQFVGGSVTVFNTHGYRISSLAQLNANSEVNLSHLPAGMYVMKFRRGVEAAVVKVMKI